MADKETPKEPMTIEEPKQEKPANNDAQELLAELQKLGLETPDQLHNVVNASQQTGRAWNEVGQLRNEVNRLTQILNQKPAKPTHYDEYSETPAVDLKELVRSETRGAIKEFVDYQNQINMAQVQELQTIQNDPDFPIVEEMWNKYIQKPDTQFMLQTGQTNMGKEYDKLVRSYYRQVAKRSRDTLQGLITKTPASQTAPHMEQGDSQSIPLPKEEDEKKQKFKQIDEARSKGQMSSDDALQAIINQSLSKDDPIWHTR